MNMAALTAHKSKLSGAERAAVLLLTLAESDAAAVLQHMSPAEVRSIAEAMASMDIVPRETVRAVLGEFCTTVNELTELGLGSQEYLCRLLPAALGEDRARDILDRILPGHHSRGLANLKWMGPRAVADLLRLEHPQIIALVLSCLEQDQAADVLAALPENQRADVVMRIASLDGIQSGAIRELDDMLEKHYSGNRDTLKSAAIGGMQTAASVMRFLDSNLGTELIRKIRQIDEDVAAQIQELMFTFDNLVEIDDRDIQVLLREISSETLILALKGANDDIREKVFRNMSRRAAEMLRDDLDVRGPVRLSEVHKAQKDVVSIARQMAEVGEIVLGGRGSEEYI